MENQTTPANNAMPRRVSQVLLTGARRLLAAGIESGRLDAELLLGHVLGMSREQLVIGASMPLSQEQWQSYESILLRRLDAEPTAYITGRQEFWSKDFRVTPDVLIPRPETECLVEIALKLAAGWHEPLRILDLGTGSGAIAIALAGELPKADDFRNRHLSRRPDSWRGKMRRCTAWRVKFIFCKAISSKRSGRSELNSI